MAFFLIGVVITVRPVLLLPRDITLLVKIQNNIITYYVPVLTITSGDDELATPSPE